MAFQPITDADLVALWRSLFPAGYTRPIEIEASGQGMDSIRAQAVQLARTARAANTNFQSYYLRHHSDETAPPASGARRATTSLLVSRAAPATGAVTLIAGVEFQATVRTSRGVVLDGVRFRVTADTVLAAGSVGPFAVTVEGSRVGYSGNVPAGSVAAFALRGVASVNQATVEAGNVLRDAAGAFGGDRLTPMMVGQYVRLVGGLNGGTIPRRVISVTQPTATNPTASAVLDGAALLFPDTLARAEVLEFGDLGLTVEQPNDAVGGVDGILDAIGDERNMPRQLGETDEPYRLRLGNLADVVSPGAIQRIASSILSPLGIVWRFIETRDPGTLIGFVYDFHAWDFGSIDNGVVFAPPVRYFAILVAPGNQGEFGFHFDTPGADNAWDHSFFDGFPVTYYSAMAALWATVEAARAAGVAWDLILDDSL